MDTSILAKFPDDDHVLGPFLGNLPPDVLDEVIKRLGWFKTTFALAGKTCREVVTRVPMTQLGSKISGLEHDTLKILLGCHPEEDDVRVLKAAIVDGDLLAVSWLMEHSLRPMHLLVVPSPTLRTRRLAPYD